MDKPKKTMLVTTVAAAAVLIICLVLAFAQGNTGFGVAGIVIAVGILLVPTLAAKSPEPEEAPAPVLAPQQPQPVGVTADGQPVYALVGRTADGSPVYADQMAPAATKAPAAAAGTNAMAVLALVFGLLIGVLGIIFGHIALAQIKRTGERGEGLATAGLVLGYLWVVIWVLMMMGGAFRG